MMIQHHSVYTVHDDSHICYILYTLAGKITQWTLTPSTDIFHYKQEMKYKEIFMSNKIMKKGTNPIAVHLSK